MSYRINPEYTAFPSPENSRENREHAATTRPSRGLPFVAIDFETADVGADSACSVALVRVEGGQIARRESRLIRPPRSRFQFTHIHGIRWQDVERCSTFQDVWPELVPMLAGAEFLAAHNAPFDRRVLEACCLAAGIEPPRIALRCTVQVARAAWRVFPTRLPDVCRFLSIPLVHHDALSDAEACAQIVIAAESGSAPLRPAVTETSALRAADSATDVRRPSWTPKGAVGQGGL